MNAILFKPARAIVTAALLLGSLSASAGSVTIGGFTPGGLQLAGTTSTSTSNSKDALNTVGWVLIVVGSLVRAGDANAASATVQGDAIWDALVRESRVYAKNPELAQPDIEMSQAAAGLGLSNQQLANLVLDVEAHKSTTAEIQSKYFPKGFTGAQDSKSFANLIALSEMM